MQRLRILVGDDGTHFARGFAESLRALGCICSVHYQSVPNMIRCVVAEQPDAVIIDISAGSVWHYDLLKAVCKCTNAPVFAVTTVYRHMLDTDLCRVGVVSIRKKPVEAALMLREIAICVYGAQTYARYRLTTIEMIVSDFLQQLGAAANMAGFRYLHSILCRTVEDPSLVHGICTKLYPVVAEEYHVNVPCVERNIRTLLADVWNHTNVYVLSEALHYPTALLHNRLPNSKFIAGATEALRMDSRVQLFLGDDPPTEGMPLQDEAEQEEEKAREL